MTQPPRPELEPPQLREIVERPAQDDGFGGFAPPPPAVAAQEGTVKRKRRTRWLPKTLGGQFVVGVVALLLVVVTISGAATYFLLRPFLVQRLDQQLTNYAVGNATSIRNCIQSGADRCSFGMPNVSGAAQIATEREWIAGFDSSGTSLFEVGSAAPSTSPLNLTDSDRAAVLVNPGKSRTVTTTDGQRLRVQASQFRLGGGVITVVTGVSLESVDLPLRRLLLLELFVGIGALVLAAGVTGWGVRRGLRPLYRVTRTAQEVTAELGPDGSGLERRVPDADPTTEVGQVASSMNTLLEAVQTEFAARVRSEERMRQFLADASHELRTPLTSIRGYAELSRLQGRSTDDPDDSMGRIEVEGTRMSRLVEDLLVLARGDQGTIVRRELVEIDQVLTEAANAVQAAHPDRPLSVVRSGGAVVIGDRDQLRRVLINLATNAAVHTPSGGIRLEAVPGRTPAGDAVALRVIDTGPGLPPEEAAHVFERFWRADKARTRAKGGSGLGMAIVAQIVQAHGGTVHFDSSVSAGTTVTVTLPTAETTQLELTAVPPESATRQN